MSNWYAIYTRGNCEGKVLDRLTAQAIEAFWPHYRVAGRRHGGPEWVDKPLFPGYLFARFNPEAPVQVVSTLHVVRILSDERSRPIPIPAVEIDQLKAVLAAGFTGLPGDEWQRPAIGTAVEVTYGALVGVRGILVREKGRERARVVIQVSAGPLQSRGTVEVDVRQVRVVQGQKAA